MNFWRTSSYSALIAAALVWGLAAIVGCALETKPETPETAWASLSHLPFAGDKQHSDSADCMQDEQESDDSESRLKKRSRRAWRPDRNLAIALVPTTTPAEASLTTQLVSDPTSQPPAASDMMFIVGGWSRLFQKG